MRLDRTRLDDPDALRLIAALNRELEARYPEDGANHFRLDPDEVARGRGAFSPADRGAAPARTSRRWRRRAGTS